VKGETSGNARRSAPFTSTADGDTLLLRVVQHGGAACHEGYPSCFFRRRSGEAWEIIEQRVVDPATLYKQR